jgi:AbrB family looped-hinge helix DNA binding protein
VRRVAVDVAARVTSQGQVTVPKAVRDALGIQAGDVVVFRVEDHRAVMARTPEFLALAGTIRVPAAKRNIAWDAVIRRTRSDRAALSRALVDTNVIVRHLMGDPADLAARATALLSSERELLLTDLVATETGARAAIALRSASRRGLPPRCGHGSRSTRPCA